MTKLNLSHNSSDHKPWFIYNKISWLMYSSLLIIGNCGWIEAVHGKAFFDHNALELDNPNQDVIDLSLFADANNQPPGTYRVALYLNGEVVDTRDVLFVLDEHKKLQAQLTKKDFATFGVRVDAFPAFNTIDNDAYVNNIADIIPSASTALNFNKLRLDISIPQAALNRQASGSVDPSLLDQGIPALLLNYSMNGSHTEYEQGGGNRDSYFVNLQSGINLDAWRLRNYSTYHHSDEEGGRIDSISTYAQRDIQALKGQLTLGDSYTPADVFDSIQFRGVQLASDENMLPDSMRGFAPTVRGIARSNAKVTIKQGGYIIYQSYVAPGAFIIQDLYPTSASGNLQVTITESDGSERTFIQPFSAVPIMQREGGLKYAVTAGRYRASREFSNEPNFGQATALYGLPHSMTIYGGMLGAENYRTIATGLGFGLDELGSISFDITHADTNLRNDSKKSGQSYRAQYSKGLQTTGTTFTLAAYRYSTDGYYSFQEANELDSHNAEDHLGLNYNKRQRLQLDISQNIGDYGSLYFSGSQQDYWGAEGEQRLLTAGYNTSYAGISYGLSYTYSQSAGDAPTDQRLAFNMQIPLSLFTDDSRWNSTWASYNMSTDKQGNTSHLAGVNGTALEDNNLSYSALQSYGNHGQGSASNLSIDYQGAHGSINAGYSKDKDSQQLNYGVRGGLIAHEGGVVLSQSLGESIAIVHAPEADNVTIQNQTGVKTDSRGYAVVPFVNAYKSNRIALDTTTLSDDVDIDVQTQTVYPTKGAVVLANFNTHVGRRVVMTLEHQGRLLPFGAAVTVLDSGTSGIVSDNGQVYLTGLAESGSLEVKWGQDDASHCRVNYTLPVENQGQGITQINSQCR